MQRCRVEHYKSADGGRRVLRCDAVRARSCFGEDVGLCERGGRGQGPIYRPFELHLSLLGGKRDLVCYVPLSAFISWWFAVLSQHSMHLGLL